MKDSVFDRIMANVGSQVEYCVSNALDDLLPLVESPIEGMLLAAMHIACRLSHLSQRTDHQGTLFQVRKFGDPETSVFHAASIKAETQYRWRNYRIDFALFMHDHPNPLIFIECDGHEFHERTADQAERDRSRDREIQQEGILVLRFTGREIWRNPFVCAWEAMNSLPNQLDRAEANGKNS